MILVALGIVTLALVVSNGVWFLLLREVMKDNEEARQSERESWERERNRLVSRIQHPELPVPPALSEDAPEIPQIEPDEYSLVGEIQPMNGDDG